jgi:hypothetical protein
MMGTKLTIFTLILMETGLPLFMLPSVYSFKYQQFYSTSVKDRRSRAFNNFLECTAPFPGRSSSEGNYHDKRTFRFVAAPTHRAGLFPIPAALGFRFRRACRRPVLQADEGKSSSDTLHADEGSEESFARDAAWEAFIEDDVLNDKLLQSVRNERAQAAKKAGTAINLWDMYGLFMKQVFLVFQPLAISANFFLSRITRFLK